MRTYLDAALEGKNDWWRFLIAVPFILGAWLILGMIPIIALIVYATLDTNPSTDVMNGVLAGVDPILYFIAAALSVIPLLLSTLIAVRVIHQRPVRSIITASHRINWRRFFQGFIMWMVLSALMSFVEALVFTGRYQISLHLSQLLPFVALIVILIPLQTSAEEVFTRGYVLQSFGLRIKNPYILSSISGFLFALLHLANPEISVNAWLMFAFYFVMGAFSAWITLKDNGLELALALHAANNIYTSIFANYTISAIPTPAIFTIKELDATYILLSTIIAMIAFYIMAFKLNQRIFTGASVEAELP